MLSKEQQENILATLPDEFMAEDARDITLSSKTVKGILLQVFNSIRIRASFGFTADVVTIPVLAEEGTTDEGVIELVANELYNMGYYVDYLHTRIEGGDCWCIRINWSISQYDEDIKGLSSRFKAKEEE
jgi:hypothetical protein